jgi:hypothetical protein
MTASCRSLDTIAAFYVQNYEYALYIRSCAELRDGILGVALKREKRVGN